MSIADLYEKVMRKHLRFSSPKGELTVEMLWDLPVVSTGGPSLNSVGKMITQELRDAGDNLVETEKSAKQVQLEVKLEVVKHIIATKQAEKDAADKAAAGHAEKAQLLDILAEKEAGELSALSKEELRKRIAALSS